MDTPALLDGGNDAERRTLLITYILHAIAPFTAGILGVIAVIIGYIKVGETQSAFIRSHHQWLIRTFWWALLWLVISYILFLILVGYAVYAVMAIWWLYRTVRGFINFNENRPMPV